ncbi:hypothetical protein LC605_24120 [Nostoc sp. CHAB 5836]|uniref:hypothetical protein n=1 Tax=Nostoc sp. CHAB 5836 TaxID=2780404 RepID=UPI001E6110B4|nr:hypothetical protein [Nostoc sp. CHAB 5836]MCC5618115.1 hypothetical protein [Nostoc sp. CHAB 5836]
MVNSANIPSSEEAIDKLSDLVKGLISKETVTASERDDAKLQVAQLFATGQANLEKINQLIDIAAAALPGNV